MDSVVRHSDAQRISVDRPDGDEKRNVADP
jgi:hypothetical protein